MTEKRIVSAVALFMLTCSGAASALEIGALQVESHLGEAFRAWVPVISTPDENVNSSCVTLGQGASMGNLFQLKHATLAVESANGKQIVKISTSQDINEPILTLQLRIHCSSQAEIGKTFTVFLDPTTLAPPASPHVPSEIGPASNKIEPIRIPEPKEKANGNQISIKPHDTLSGIAYDLFPHDRSAQKRFIASVLTENPGLSPNRLQVGAVLRIPDLRSMGTPASARPKPPQEHDAPARPRVTSSASAKILAKPAFHLDIVSGESEPGTGTTQDLRRTETQLITRTDDQTVQLRQLQDQVKSLEAKLAELHNRVVVANKLLASINVAKAQAPREAEKPVSRYVWIAAILVLLGVASGVYWFVRKRKAQEQEALMEQYLNPTLSKPALIDHLDYFESDTPDHHKW
jgi:pilus assembly protein FimV